MVGDCGPRVSNTSPPATGSHHWNVTGESGRWFFSVDDLEARRRDATETRRDAAQRLSAALTVAGSLCGAGLDFVVAPTSTLGGANLQAIDDRYVLALYPYIDGEAHAYGPYPTRPERLAVLDRVYRVHMVDPSVAGSAVADDFLIPRRDELVVTLANDELPWGPGPYAAPARARLRRHRGRCGGCWRHTTSSSCRSRPCRPAGY